MSWYYLEKEFYDYADDIEGVNIHYLWTPIDGVADWENQRATRFMPLVQQPPPSDSDLHVPTAEVPSSPSARLRKKILKLPQRILDPESGTLTDCYLLHHYFEVFQDGHRHYSPLYTEEVVTGSGTHPVANDSTGTKRSVPPLTTAYAGVQESKE
jgi:hypothetical protein